MITAVSFIIVLGILIFIHEFGHFIMAKFCGVGVEQFSLGFGPRIIGVKWGETEYRVSLLPLGGYVKMVGESPEDDVLEEDRDRAFTAKSVSKRAAIVASGPLMNLALMIVLMPLIYMIGINVPAYLKMEPLVGYVKKGSIAERSGLKKGDIISEVDDKRVKNWDELTEAMLSNPNKRMKLKVYRGKKVFYPSVHIAPSDKSWEGIAGIYPPMKPIIGAVSNGYPADEAGMKVGDIIQDIDNIRITHWAEVKESIQGAVKEKAITLKRDGDLIKVRVKPRWNEDIKEYLIGISPLQETVVKRYGFFESISNGMKRAWELTIFTFIVLKKLIVGEISVKTLGGPIMIAKVAGQAAESGITALLTLMASLSLQLGILNLIPIPVLDGGHLFFFGLERIRGKPLNDKYIMISQQVGIALLILLMILVTCNDILRIIER